MKNTLFVLLSLLLSVSCKEHKQQNAETLQNEYTVRQIDIPSSADILELKSYNVTAPIDFDSIKGFIAYNYRTHSLDLVNLHGEHHISSISLQREGPDGIQREICGICPTSEDSIWVYDTVAMYLLNKSGKVQHKIILGNRESIMINANYAMNTAKFIYNSAHHSLLYPAKRNSFVIEEYDIQQEKVIKTYPLSYAESNPEGALVYGDMDYPNVSFTENNIIYNYPYESAIYVLHMDSGKHSTIKAESHYTPNQAQQCIQNGSAAWEKHRIENIHFYEVMYVPQANRYYRLHTNGVEYDTNQSVLSMLDSRSIYLMTFDKDFKPVSEHKLADKRYNYFTGWCALSDALLLFNENSLSESTDYEGISMDLISNEAEF